MTRRGRRSCCEARLNDEKVTKGLTNEFSIYAGLDELLALQSESSFDVLGRNDTMFGITCSAHIVCMDSILDRLLLLDDVA